MEGFSRTERREMSIAIAINSGTWWNGGAIMDIYASHGAAGQLRYSIPKTRQQTGDLWVCDFLSQKMKKGAWAESGARVKRCLI